MRHRSRRLLVFMLAALPGLLGCRQKTVRGADYELPVPSGWGPLAEVRPPAGAVALFAPSRVRPGAFLGSVVVTLIPPSEPRFDPTSLSACHQLGQSLAASTGDRVTSARIIQGPFGRTCEVRTLGTSDGTPRGGTFTVLRGPRGDRALTCNYDPSDDAALRACQSVRDGFRFDP